MKPTTRVVLFIGAASRYQSSQFAVVDLVCGILRPDAFEVDHRGLDVAVSHPCLYGANVHTITKMVGGVMQPQ